MSGADEVMAAYNRVEGLIAAAEAGKGAVIAKLRDAATECQRRIDVHGLGEDDKTYFRERRDFAIALLVKKGGKPA